MNLPGNSAAANATVIDLRGQTVLPGLIDTHVHVTYHFSHDRFVDNRLVGQDEPVPDSVLFGVENGVRILEAGFTTVQSLGPGTAWDLPLREAWARNLVPGPRLWVVTRAIVASGCYGPGPRGFRDDLVLPQGGQAVSGVPEILEAVREQAGHGAGEQSDGQEARQRVDPRERRRRALQRQAGVDRQLPTRRFRHVRDGHPAAAHSSQQYGGESDQAQPAREHRATQRRRLGR